MKKLASSLVIISSLFWACSKSLDPGTESSDPETEIQAPELGEFQLLKYSIDLSKENKYDESLFVNEWILTNVSCETYVDGVFKKTQDVTRMWAVMEYSFRDDHTMSFFEEDQGPWLYCHNCLIWGCYAYEVVRLEPGILHLKGEEFPYGIPYTPFFKNKSGTHQFYVFEYRAK